MKGTTELQRLVAREGSMIKKTNVGNISGVARTAWALVLRNGYGPLFPKEFWSLCCLGHCEVVPPVPISATPLVDMHLIHSKLGLKNFEKNYGFLTPI